MAHAGLTTGASTGPAQELTAAQQGLLAHLFAPGFEHQTLCGGFSAYDNTLCMRPFPLVLVATWTQFLRDDYGLDPELLVVGGSFNLQRFMLLDSSTGELLVSPANAQLPGREVRTVNRTLRMIRAVPTTLSPCSQASPGADLLAWMEELSVRAASDALIAEPLLPLETSSVGLSAFPRAGPRHSSAVTRGIRVLASSLCSPELGM